MTVVMVWKEAGAKRLWLVSDGRLSRPGAVGTVRLTDHAAKILELPRVLNAPQPAQAPLKITTLGFAYAGGSLVALQAYAAVLPLWSRLQTSASEVLPTVEQCSEHLAKFLTAYASDVAATGASADCQCLLSGYDEQTQTLDAWLIDTEPSSRNEPSVRRRLDLSGPGEAFGSGQDKALEHLEQWRQEGVHWHRQPLHVIRELLAHDEPGPIGGGVQIGMVTPSGFELFYDAQPFTAGSRVGSPLVSMLYRGFQFTEVGRVGDAFVALRGLGQ